jgi:hypothetical protein
MGRRSCFGQVDEVDHGIIKGFRTIGMLIFSEEVGPVDAEARSVPSAITLRLTHHARISPHYLQFRTDPKVLLLHCRLQRRQVLRIIGFMSKQGSDPQPRGALRPVPDSYLATPPFLGVGKRGKRTSSHASCLLIKFQTALSLGHAWCVQMHGKMLQSSIDN